MGTIVAWQGFTQRHPVAVTASLTLFFTAWVAGTHALSSNVYYSNNETMPAALGWTIAALYLATTFVMALILN